MLKPRHVAVLWVALSASLAAAGRAKAPPKIKIAKDTTFITQPLKADGTPDYLGAINRQFGAGATGANNAAIPLLRALGPGRLPAETGKQILKRLGLTLPANGDYLRFPPEDTAAGKHLRSGWRRPWASKQHPEFVKWLRAYDKPLALIVAASKRSRYYLPAVAGKRQPALLGMEIPNYLPLRQAIRALRVRAALAAGEGRADNAVADLKAAYRLGALVGQDYTLVGRLVSTGIMGESMEAMAALAVVEKLSAKQALALIDVLRAGAPPSPAPALQTERYATLDMAIWFARKPSVARLVSLARSITEAQQGTIAKGPLPAGRPEDTLFRQADYSEVLRRANAVFDATVAAAHPATFADRLKTAGALSPVIGAIRAGAAKEPDLQANKATATKWVSDNLLAALLPNLGRAVVIMDKAQVRRSVTAVALALATYRAETGSYPADLKVLAPKYLKRVPIDWCSGKPLIYKRTAKGFLLYSVGENMRDDGGRDRSDNKAEDDDYDDIVVKAPPGD